MKSSDVRAAIASSYRQPEWATFFEVADGTGMRKTRSADAVSVNMYPSRGLTINGFEIKVDRSDWRRELADPSKAEAIARYCDFWWVAAPKGLIDPVTLPATWGLTEVDEKGALRIKAQAKQLKSIAVNRNFFAAKTAAADAVLKQHAAFAGAMSRYGKLSHMKEDEIVRGLEMLDDLGILGGWGPLRNLVSAAKNAARVVEKLETDFLKKETS